MLPGPCRDKSIEVIRSRDEQQSNRQVQRTSPCPLCANSGHPGSTTDPAVTDVGSTRCKISTRAWPFGKYLWLRVLCLRNGMGAPNFLGSPKITVRLDHQFAFFHLVARGSRAGIHLPRPVP